MIWHYQIMRHISVDDDWFAIHEVYEDEDGTKNWTTEGTAVIGDNREDVIEVLKMMLKDATEYPVLDCVTGKEIKESK